MLIAYRAESRCVKMCARSKPPCCYATRRFRESAEYAQRHRTPLCAPLTMLKGAKPSEVGRVVGHTRHLHSAMSVTPERVPASRRQRLCLWLIFPLVPANTGKAATCHSDRATDARAGAKERTGPGRNAPAPVPRLYAADSRLISEPRSCPGITRTFGVARRYRESTAHRRLAMH